MPALIENPAIQSGIIPFVIALFALLVLRPLKGYWAGLALVIAFYSGVYLVVGFQFTPLTSTRKLFLVGIGATVLGLILDNVKLDRRYTIALLGILASLSALWLIWPVISRKEGLAMWSMALSAIVYAAWITVLVERNRTVQPAIFAGIFAIAIGTGISALLGASALLGQLGGSLGAATGAFILMALINKPVACGISFTLPAAILCALIGISAVTYAQLPWYSLLMIASIPLIVNIPLPPSTSIPKQLLLMCALTMALAIAAIGMTWQVSGPPPL